MLYMSMLKTPGVREPITNLHLFFDNCVHSQMNKCIYHCLPQILRTIHLVSERKITY